MQVWKIVWNFGGKCRETRNFYTFFLSVVVLLKLGRKSKRNPDPLRVERGNQGHQATTGLKAQVLGSMMTLQAEYW